MKSNMKDPVAHPILTARKPVRRREIWLVVLASVVVVCLLAVVVGFILDDGLGGWLFVAP